MKRIDQAGIIVGDSEATAALSGGRFGFVLSHVEDPQDGSARIAYLHAGATTLHLLQPSQADPIGERLSVQGEGLDHICFLVDSLGEALSSLSRGDGQPWLGVAVPLRCVSPPSGRLVS